MKAVIAGVSLLVLSGCSFFEGLVYRIDIPQGNFLEQGDIDKLRVGMTKEQVEYVLGAPVSRSAFSQDKWFFVYQLDPGGSGEFYRRDVVLTFENDILAEYEGDFDRPENFDTPLEQ